MSQTDRKCQAHGCGGVMEPRKPGTPEQAFCGEWVSCTRCHSSSLSPSRALLAQLAAMQTKREQPQQGNLLEGNV